MSETLDIQILGKDYRVACSAEERATLARAVAVLQGRLAATREKSRTSGEKLAVMVALELAHEWVQAQGENGRSAGSESASSGAEKSSDNFVDSENLQRSIKSIEAKIAAALEPDETLP